MIHISNENARKYIKSLPEKPRVPLSEVINCDNKLALDLLEKMLDLNAQSRITVEECIQHP
jgi:serine/threonine protein kinase